ncbi:aminotransferase class V-fold PLP-dependent enzyme [Mesorhizobium sp. IMUNJ 23232]|uniref:aminotransferase class V-fold PLP-dependent enzyme n=1 Tax=Mesorhizobium sp. IMUNJ 23232 TaxID=3376064 RepID=UPI00378E7309
MQPWTTAEVERARAQTPVLAARVHLNSCGTGAMPGPVLDAVVEHLRREATEGGYEAANARRDLVDRVYADIATLLGAAPAEIALFDSATSAWHALFGAISFKAGDRILTGRNEYASNMMSFLRVRDLYGVEIDIAPDGAEGSMDVDALAALLGSRTRLIAVTHVPTNSGTIAPVARIGEIARRSGILFLLDACQSVGQMPVDVHAIGCDLLTAAGRKFLRGPRGTGFAYVGPKARAQLRPALIDIQSGDWVDRDRYAIRDDALQFERWERSVANALGLGVAVRYAQTWSLNRIASRVQWLAGLAREDLQRIPRVRVHDRGSRLAGIVSFSVSGHRAEDIVAAALEAGFNISRSRILDARLDLENLGVDAVCRVAPHYFNRPDEITAFADFVRAYVKREARIE